MRHRPAPNDLDGWVAQLGHSRYRQEAKVHLLSSGPRALPAVQRGLRHPTPIVRRQCVNLLDHLVDEATLPDLIAALDDPDPEVTARVLHALACDRCKEGECRPGEDAWVPRALHFLQVENADLRAAAIDALGKVADRMPDVESALRSASDRDPDPGLRSMARWHVTAGGPS